MTERLAMNINVLGLEFYVLSRDAGECCCKYFIGYRMNPLDVSSKLYQIVEHSTL